MLLCARIQMTDFSDSGEKKKSPKNQNRKKNASCSKWNWKGFVPCSGWIRIYNDILIVNTFP